MAILCKALGHRRPTAGWWGDGLYGRVVGAGRDGIGRTHYRIEHECPRCGRSYTAARFHGTDPALATKDTSL